MRKTFGFTSKTIGFKRKICDFTHETVIYDNGLPYTHAELDRPIVSQLVP